MGNKQEKKHTNTAKTMPIGMKNKTPTTRTKKGRFDVFVLQSQTAGCRTEERLEKNNAAYLYQHLKPKQGTILTSTERSSSHTSHQPM